MTTKDDLFTQDDIWAEHREGLIPGEVKVAEGDIELNEGRETLSSGDFLLIRYLGHSSEQARKLFTRCWGVIRPELLGIPHCTPRIWAT